MSGSTFLERQWFAVVLIQGMLIQCFATALRPILAYAMIATGASSWWLAVLAASFAVPALVLALPVGRFVDVFGEREAATIGAVLVLIGAAIALVWHGTPASLVAASVFAGAGHLPSVLVGQTQVAHRTTAHRLDSVYGYFTVANALGQLVGPLLLLLPGDVGALPPVTAVLVGCVVIAVALLVVALLVTSSRRSPSPPGQGSALRQAKGLLRQGQLVRALLVGAAVVGVSDVVQVYWPALGVERGFDAAVVSVMLSLRAVASMASRIGMGVLVSRYGRAILLISSTLGGGILLAITAVPLPAWGLIGAAALFGFMIGVCTPLSMAWLAAITPAHNRGVSMSIRLGANRLGQTCVPLALGAFATAAGAAGVMLASAVVLAATAGLARGAGAAATRRHLD